MSLIINLKKMAKYKYRIDQLIHLAKIRALEMDNTPDSFYTSDRVEFVENTDLFFNWIERMESKDMINELLNTKINH